MPTPPNVVVVHVVTAETSPTMLAVLRTLYACPDLARRQAVILVGAARNPLPEAAHVRVHAPFDFRPLGAAALARELRRRKWDNEGCPTILHAWSATAAQWCAPLTSGRRALLIEHDLEGDARRLGPRLALTERSSGFAVYVCPSMTARRRLLELGLPADRCALIPPADHAAALPLPCRSGARMCLALDAQNVAILALPPVARCTGTFFAAWAAMLLEKVRPEVRVVVPTGTSEAGRIARLVHAGRHAWMARFAPADMELAELLAAADLVAYLPTQDASTATLLQAMVVGRPIVATAVPVVCELLVDGETAWLCTPRDPADAARQMLQTLEHPAEAQRRAEQARARGMEIRSPTRMIEDYRAIYGSLPGRAAQQESERARRSG